MTRVNAICTSKCLFTDQNLLRIYSELLSKKVRSTQVLVSKPSNIRNDLFHQKAVFDNRVGDGHFEESCNILVFQVYQYVVKMSKSFVIFNFKNRILTHYKIIFKYYYSGGFDNMKIDFDK